MRFILDLSHTDFFFEGHYFQTMDKFNVDCAVVVVADNIYCVTTKTGKFSGCLNLFVCTRWS